MEEGLVLWGVKSIFYVEDDQTREYKCVIKGKQLNNEFDLKGRTEAAPIVSGDRVLFEKIDSSNGVIVKRLPRKNEFKRLKGGGRTVQTLAANVDSLIIVDSVVSPPTRTFFIDRCLFTADLMGIEAVVVFNKVDLLEETEPQEFRLVQQVYRNLGYSVIKTSAVTGEGLEKLKEVLRGKLCSFNGRSGVGKSSLVKALDPAYGDIRVGEVSRKFNRGTHTTTHAKIYDLGFGAKLMDTPGVREFSLFIDKPEKVERYFRDFQPYRNCKFSNCQHINEPECAVLQAVREGKIEPFRYESYVRMKETVVWLSDSKL